MAAAIRAPSMPLPSAATMTAPTRSFTLCPKNVFPLAAQTAIKIATKVLPALDWPPIKGKPSSGITLSISIFWGEGASSPTKQNLCRGSVDCCFLALSLALSCHSDEAFALDGQARPVCAQAVLAHNRFLGELAVLGVSISDSKKG